MLHVKTYIESSNIHGIGLFAGEDIKKGTLLWSFNPRWSIYFTPQEVEVMDDIQKETITHFATLSKKTGMYVYSIDNSRFMNHSHTPNTMEDLTSEDSLNMPEYSIIATHDIQKGDELTIDYRAIDSVDAYSNQEYLIRNT